jgi:EAL domain-containing protein (putative c-di-GMP-specific phosphodiesterase class I)
MLLLDKALREWSTTFSRLGIPVAVNLSPRNLQNPELPDRMKHFLESRSIAPSMLQLEITENFVMSDPARAANYLRRLHDMGMVLAIDDFGTGYSSLSYLRQLPVDVLKIDRSFVVELSRTPDAIVKCAIDLAHNLGLAVVAEGVESASVLDRLKELGCDIAQGFFLALPRPAQETLFWIEQRHRTVARVHTHTRTNGQ